MFLAALAGCGGGQESERRLSLYTHCGVLSAFVDGQLWLASPPLRRGYGNPLPGWDFNDTPGTWRELADDEAEFRATSGKTARFVRARPGQRDPAAGCE